MYSMENKMQLFISIPKMKKQFKMSEMELYQNSFLLLFQVIQISKSPLTITLIALKTANTGLLVNLENDLSVVVNDLAQAVVEN